MKTTRRNFWQTTFSGLLALGGSLLVPSSLNAAPRDSGLRYFGDEHGTEFQVPYQVRAGQPFNIQLRVGNHEEQIIRKIAFLTDWGVALSILSSRLPQPKYGRSGIGSP